MRVSPCLLGALVASIPMTAFAQAETPASYEEEAAPAPPAAPSAPTPAPAPPPGSSDSARFSVGRMIGELLVGGVVGGGAAYLTYGSICTDDPCIGGFLAGAGANLVGTTLGVYGTGALFGGAGTFGSTVLGVLLPFAATGPVASQAPLTALAISFTLAPITGALMYELSSNAQAKARSTTARVQPFFAGAPRDLGAARGGVAGLVGVF